SATPSATPPSAAPSSASWGTAPGRAGPGPVGKDRPAAEAEKLRGKGAVTGLLRKVHSDPVSLTLGFSRPSVTAQVVAHPAAAPGRSPSPARHRRPGTTAAPPECPPPATARDVARTARPAACCPPARRAGPPAPRP